MKTSILPLFLLLLFSIGNLNAQVGIGTTNPDDSAELDVTSPNDNKGFLPPRLDTDQRNGIANPAAGLVIYNTDINCLEVWNSTTWVNLCTVAPPPVAPEACDNDVSDGTGTIVQMFYDFDGDGVGEFSWCAREVGLDTDNADGDNDPTTGTIEQVWLDRNLGAWRVATASNDAQGYGDLYQWGRAMDGHQKRYQLNNDPIEGGGSQGGFANGAWFNSNNATNNPTDTRFIIRVIDPEGDWVVDNNFDRWITGDNIPCPVGYTVPSLADFDEADDSFTTSLIDSPLRLPSPGARNGIDGFDFAVGFRSLHWTNYRRW